MKATFVIPLIAVIALITVAILKATDGGKQKRSLALIRRKTPLTKNEQPMYFRLIDAFPEHVVLAQVAFSALIETKDRATRNTFDRKVADFVLCTKAFEVVAVIELDDSSHKGREKEDAKRAALLTNAGHRVVRYKLTPDVATLRKELLPTLQMPSAQENKATV